MVLADAMAMYVFYIRFERLSDIIEFFVIIIGFSFFDNAFEKTIRNMD
jgi:hypothetical protein